jgi:hypothetical protein
MAVVIIDTVIPQIDTVINLSKKYYLNSISSLC